MYVMTTQTSYVMHVQAKKYHKFSYLQTFACCSIVEILNGRWQGRIEKEGMQLSITPVG